MNITNVQIVDFYCADNEQHTLSKYSTRWIFFGLNWRITLYSNCVKSILIMCLITCEEACVYNIWCGLQERYQEKRKNLVEYGQEYSKKCVACKKDSLN